MMNYKKDPRDAMEDFFESTNKGGKGKWVLDHGEHTHLQNGNIFWI